MSVLSITLQCFCCKGSAKCYNNYKRVRKMILNSIVFLIYINNFLVYYNFLCVKH